MLRIQACVVVALTTSAIAQRATIRGTVVDEAGLPVADTVVLASVWLPLYARMPIAVAPPDAVIVELLTRIVPP